MARQRPVPTTPPIAITGQTNGQAYTFTVEATNLVGPGSASGLSTPVTATATAANPMTNPNCRLAAAEFRSAVPTGYSYSHGSFEFLATGCSQGVTITLSYSQALALLTALLGALGWRQRRLQRP